MSDCQFPYVPDSLYGLLRAYHDAPYLNTYQMDEKEQEEYEEWQDDVSDEIEMRIQKGETVAATLVPRTELDEAHRLLREACVLMATVTNAHYLDDEGGHSKALRRAVMEADTFAARHGHRGRETKAEVQP